ncbi:MAG: hypothetical protein M1823_001661 [Watsoniomyces obsoletus]|nr:MAG: hypothetical protein M1823_001661 [Watsoniomyces obsoletus]
MRVATERSYNTICQRCRVRAVARPPLSRRIWSLAGSIPSISSRDERKTVKSVIKPKIRAPVWHQIRSATFSAKQSKRTLQELQQRKAALLGPPDVMASESEVEKLLKDCAILASQIAQSLPKAPELPSKEQGNPAAALLGIDRGGGQNPAVQPPSDPNQTKELIEGLSNLAYEIVIHPHVFFSELVLRHYVTLQAHLRRPESYPEIFTLYANKPLPRPNTKPVKFRKPNPRQAKFAIPPSVAALALKTTMSVKDLELALAIIETSYALPAFRRSKVIRKALLPGAALTLTPLAAYAVAARVSADSIAGDGYLSTEVAFAGILTYVSFTGMLGFVALTTANDQMERVTWVPGTPLRERWLREDERAAIDKVAGAWGFKNPLRRGEEEGEEWEALRNWIARKGMILDKESLMPGMN